MCTDDLRPSELVRCPESDEVDVLGARGFEESFCQEVDVGGVDGNVRGRLPFDLKIGLCAEKALVVRVAGHERNARRLVERIVCAVAPENVNANLDGEVPQRLNGNRREDIDDVDGRIDRGLREIREFWEQRIEALECPVRTATTRDVGLQPEPRLAPEAREGKAGVGSHRPGADIAGSKVSKLKHAFEVVVPGLGSTPEARTHGVPRLGGHAGIERRILANEAEIVEIDGKSG